MTRMQRNERRVLMAQLNTMRRLRRLPEIKRFRGDNRRLNLLVSREYKR